jgi:Zn-dependent peptidase ImmA (M78 family)
MVHLLESRGVRVFSLSEDSRSMDAFSCWRGGVPYVFLNTMKTAEHSRMDAAHELGHLVLHWDGVARGREVEHQAQLFASAFLMPRGSVLAEAPRSGRLDQLIKIKKNWRVSVSALAVRMKALGLLSDWQYRGLFIEMGHMGYRTTEPNGIQPETSQVLAKMFKALREEKVTQEQIAGELSIYPDELAGLVFGLVLVPVEGGGTQGGGQTRERPQLRLIS